MEDDCPGIGCGDGINESVRTALGGFDCAGADGVEGEFHVGGGEWLAVREMYVVAEMENVSLRVGHFPFFGEVRREIEMIVALEEAVEEEEVEMCGEGVGADARVEVGGHGFEEESYGGGGVLSAMGAAGHKDAENDEYEGGAGGTVKTEQQVPHTVRRRWPNGFGMKCIFG